MNKSIIIGIIISSVLLPGTVFAAESKDLLDLTSHPVGYFSLLIFLLSYVVVMAEEFTDLRKSKPVILAAGIIWGMIGYIYTSRGIPEAAEIAFKHNLLDFAELFLFLLVAMTYVNAMSERQVFQALRSWLVRKGFSYRQLFWMTGAMAFFLSPVIDNLTTALVMGAVILAVGKGNPRFVGLASINVVVAANAGGAFSPFGDITTLMVWQKGIVNFSGFFALFIPSAVNYLVPASVMYFAIPSKVPDVSGEHVPLRRGAIIIIFLFIATILTAVSFHNFLGLPPMLGMMTGLAYLKFFGYYLKKTHIRTKEFSKKYGVIGDVLPLRKDSHEAFDVFHRLARAEWDTLLFFYGVVLSVGGLGFIGYLALVSETMYVNLGATYSNVIVGLLSAVVDNIPVMFAVLSMNPEMSQGQWLLVTLTAGVGGSMLSIGSAAGVALMGQARGQYTFFVHLKWTPIIALGYAASIVTHMWVNDSLFTKAVGS
ncbi:MAG: sodium:proton antiporter NhaD [Acidiferrobacterales bacterium]